MLFSKRTVSQVFPNLHPKQLRVRMPSKLYTIPVWLCQIFYAKWVQIVSSSKCLLAYSWVFFSGNDSVPVCGAASIGCFNRAEDALFLKEFKQSIKDSGEFNRGETDCNCLPACTSIAYEAEISQADFDYKTTASEDENDTDKGYNYIRVV